jgi:hypothetical protein
MPKALFKRYLSEKIDREALVFILQFFQSGAENLTFPEAKPCVPLFVSMVTIYLWIRGQVSQHMREI